MKKGLTLIEVIMALAISLILFSVGLKVNKAFNSMSNLIMSKSAISDITNLISFGKYYCRTQEKNGSIEIYEVTGEIFFNDNSNKRKTIKKLKLPKGFRFLKNLTLNINLNGHIQSDTIRILDNRGNIFKITISTGVDFINIYEEE